MGLVLSVEWQDAGEVEAYRELEVFRLAVIKGREEVLQKLAPDSLEEQDAVLSLGIMSLVIKNLLKNSLPGQSDITTT